MNMLRSRCYYYQEPPRFYYSSPINKASLKDEGELETMAEHSS